MNGVVLAQLWTIEGQQSICGLMLITLNNQLIDQFAAPKGIVSMDNSG